MFDGSDKHQTLHDQTLLPAQEVVVFKVDAIGCSSPTTLQWTVALAGMFLSLDEDISDPRNNLQLMYHPTTHFWLCSP